jgi:hypothetical protein
LTVPLRHASSFRPEFDRRLSYVLRATLAESALQKNTPACFLGRSISRSAFAALRRAKCCYENRCTRSVVNEQRG